MLRHVRPGGTLAIEDIDLDGSFCWPPSAAYDAFVRWYGAAHRAKGGDPTIGRRLPHLVRERGLTGIDVRITHPVGFGGAVGDVAKMTLAATAPAIVACGAATSDEIAVVQAELAADVADPERIVSMPRVVQVFGTTPAGGRPGDNNGGERR